MLDGIVSVSWLDDDYESITFTKGIKLYGFPATGDLLEFGTSNWTITSVVWSKASDDAFYPIFNINFGKYRREPDEPPDSIPFWMKEDFWIGEGFFRKES